MLDHVPVPAQQICRISGELGPLDSAMQYECILQEYFKNEPPRLDMTFLNLGEDGQIAALIPGSEVLPEKNHWVKVVYHLEQKMYRITLIPHFINQARLIVFIVLGTEKASVIKRIFTGNNTHKLPAELIAPTDSEWIFLLDKGAASEII